MTSFVAFAIDICNPRERVLRREMARQRTSVEQNKVPFDMATPFRASGPTPKASLPASSVSGSEGMLGIMG
jgi:hypothetical protein